jgi:hypothetical protein
MVVKIGIKRMKDLKIKSIKSVGKKEVYDITVKDVHHYVLENGVVTHNTAVTYSSNQIFVIGKAQEKEGTEIAGYKFTINIEKSRFVREKAKLPFTVLYETGIQKWSSLFDLAIEYGSIVKINQGWYSTVDMETGEINESKRRAKDIETDDKFFKKLISDPVFKKFIESKFKMNQNGVIPNDDVDVDEEEE